MRHIDEIIIHCSYTYPFMDVGVEEIRKWHVEENNWNDIGYHYVIRRSGDVETGRPVDIPGAHVGGRNTHSIGVCLVGGRSRAPHPNCNFLPAQWDALRDLVLDLKKKYPDAAIRGHYEFNQHKTCPTFDVTAWAEGL